jgi:hypothetical protein
MLNGVLPLSFLSPGLLSIDPAEYMYCSGWQLMRERRTIELMDEGKKTVASLTPARSSGEYDCVSSSFDGFIYHISTYLHCYAATQELA